MATRTLTQKAGSSRFVGDGQWFSGSILTNPTDGTLVVDTGQLAAGNYLVAIHGAANTDVAFDVQQRNAANSANIDTQRRRPKAGDIDLVFPNKVAIADNERFRCMLVGNITGELQLSIFAQEVE